MRKFCNACNWIIIISLLTLIFTTSCENTEYKIFSLKEGIGHFSIEYPAEYTVTRIDIRNESTAQYTDVGLRYANDADYAGFREISIYIWPIDSGAGVGYIVDDLLTSASSIFNDFEIMDRYSVMIGDMEGQVAIFSWTASADTDTDEPAGSTLPAISRMAFVYHNDLAWEIHVASDMAEEAQAEAEFKHVLDTFQILN